ncbi:MAG: Cytidylate kinase [Candidatus Tokpelaia hoelldobleri]|uniref:Cytidylate kinase n=1 Tax=Candidatus Tokpelaia hoelldobleri TaxID=1902579 RepID=A0A1U9JT73_9HYPH|nr:MAG: Cytidylate kinase [Candidatus Tokpelaia hoelldoblerii]
MSRHPFVIAIDGPAASGKGTLARKIATRYGLPCLDTGLTYRAVAHAMLKQKLDMADEAAAVKIAETLDLSALDAAALSAHEIGEAASKVAVLPLLRHALVNAQRRFAANPAGAVLDGRDIGTVVCPDADIKLYIIADVEERAKRRCKEIVARGSAAVYEDILADLQRRDARDMNRTTSPLRPADDALLLNTTKLSIEEAFFAACKLIDAQKS